MLLVGGDEMNIHEIAKAIEKIEGVEGVSVWDRVEGKERVYIDTKKLNGGRSWNGGRGFAVCYLDVNSGELTMRNDAGAATRKFHDANRTAEKILAVLK